MGNARRKRHDVPRYPSSNSGARFSKVPIINGPGKLPPFTLKIEVSASNTIKLSVNETKWSSLLARTRALILYISIWIFYFGPVKLPGLSRNGPQSCYRTFSSAWHLGSFSAMLSLSISPTLPVGPVLSLPEKSALSSRTAAGNRANTTLSFFPSLIWQKIGRPSDVWSLGCILYMMVYGRTPFQHITNHLQKLQCIMDPSHVIEFPEINDKHLLDVIQVCLVICSCFTYLQCIYLFTYLFIC